MGVHVLEISVPKHYFTHARKIQVQMHAKMEVIHRFQAQQGY
jgi:hypothetical protein